MMKNKNSSIKNTLIFIAVSALIIAVGVSVPFGLLALKSRQSNLPGGVVDAENIQPYGSNTIHMEKSIVEAINFYCSDKSIFSQVDKTWIATKENDFNEIGIQNRLYEEGNPRSDEFVNTLDDIITNSLAESGFGNAIIVSSTEEISNEHTLYKISAQDNNTIVIMDGDTGVPVVSTISVITSVNPASVNRASLRSEIVSLYQDYTGLDFVYLNSDPGSVDDYDSFYLYEIENTDHTVRLTIVINSGWYWLPPDSNSEDWQPTDKYIWTIGIYCNDYYQDYVQPNAN
ncbi:MAG: hypothetical protein MJ093_06340 [Saccharofermentans sp.]|nr:hypothetical protein [Saccharofermentans sp.]